MPETTAKHYLGIIPARGGSKGIPGKNIQPLGGIPLIAWTVRAAKAAGKLTRLIVSTDSEEIAAAARDAGAETPFMRPAELAGDTASVADAVLHALDMLSEDCDPYAVVLLQPTAPLRLASDIDESIAAFDAAPGADSLISVSPASHAHPSIMYKVENGRAAPYLPEGAALRRRQDYPEAFIRNGAIYISTVELIRKQRRLVGDSPLVHIMPRERAVNIDDPLDLMLARAIVAERGLC